VLLLPPFLATGSLNRPNSSSRPWACARSGPRVS